MGAQTGNCYDGMGSTAGWKKHSSLHKICMQMCHNVPLTFLVVQGVGGAPRGLAVVKGLSVALLRVKEVLQCSIKNCSDSRSRLQCAKGTGLLQL